MIAPYMCCETDRDNQGYRKEAYIIHLCFARVFGVIVVSFENLCFFMFILYSLRSIYMDSAYMLLA